MTSEIKQVNWLRPKKKKKKAFSVAWNQRKSWPSSGAVDSGSYNCLLRMHFHNPSNKSPVFKYSISDLLTDIGAVKEPGLASQRAHTLSRATGSEVVWRPERANQGFWRLLQYSQQGLSPGVVVFGEMSRKNEQLQQQATFFRNNLENSVIVWSSVETNSIAERSRGDKWTVWVPGISRGLGNAGISLIILALSTSFPIIWGNKGPFLPLASNGTLKYKAWDSPWIPAERPELQLGLRESSVRGLACRVVSRTWPVFSLCISVGAGLLSSHYRLRSIVGNVATTQLPGFTLHWFCLYFWIRFCLYLWTWKCRE